MKTYKEDGGGGVTGNPHKGFFFNFLRRCFLAPALFSYVVIIARYDIMSAISLMINNNNNNNNNNNIFMQSSHFGLQMCVFHPSLHPTFSMALS